MKLTAGCTPSKQAPSRKGREGEGVKRAIIVQTLIGMDAMSCQGRIATPLVYIVSYLRSQEHFIEHVQKYQVFHIRSTSNSSIYCPNDIEDVITSSAVVVAGKNIRSIYCTYILPVSRSTVFHIHIPCLNSIFPTCRCW